MTKYITLIVSSAFLAGCSSGVDRVTYSPVSQPRPEHIVVKRGNRIVSADPSPEVRHMMRVDPTGSD